MSHPANPAGATLLSRIKARPSNRDPDPTPAGDGVPALEPPSPSETTAGKIASSLASRVATSIDVDVGDDAENRRNHASHPNHQNIEVVSGIRGQAYVFPLNS